MERVAEYLVALMIYEISPALSAVGLIPFVQEDILFVTSWFLRGSMVPSWYWRTLAKQQLSESYRNPNRCVDGKSLSPEGSSFSRIEMAQKLHLNDHGKASIWRLGTTTA